MAEHLTLAEMREAVSTPQAARDRGFEVLRSLAALLAAAGDEESTHLHHAREIAIRMVEHREGLGPIAAPMDAVLRRLGLFPYLDESNLSVADLMAMEMHRPLGMDTEDLVFHRVQAEVYRRLLDGENVVLSAPTSFGKSLLIDAVVASGDYRNVVIVVPTIALIDETRRRLMERFAPGFKIITHVSQPLAERNILVLTQERVLDLEVLPPLDLFVIDEFYKLSAAREKPNNRDRAYLLNQAFARLHATGAQFYFLGPNIKDLAPTIPEDFLGEFVFMRTGVSTVAVDEIRLDGGKDKHAKLVEICGELTEPTLIYCQSPRSARDVVDRLLDGKVGRPHPGLADAADWVAREYHPDWVVARALEHGIGAHHGQMPRALAQFMVRAFKDRRLRFLVCTSSLIEGVNTPAKNVIVFDKKIAKSNFDYFDYGNIRGRSGRMGVHYVGRVYLFNDKPKEQLPSVDIPALSQPEDAPASLLLGLPPDDLTPRSRARLDEVIEASTVSEATLRANVGIDPERQIAAANAIDLNINHYAPLLAWKGPSPTYDELKAVSELIWTQLNAGSGAHGARSARQLTQRIHRLRDAPSVRALVDDQSTSEYARERGLTATEIVDDVLDFLRGWATFNFPRLLMVLDRIAREVLSRRGRKTGDFSVFAANVENLFLPAPLLALEEYGLPRQAGVKMRAQVASDGDIDAALRQLATAAAPRHLHAFEAETLRDVQGSLRAIADRP